MSYTKLFGSIIHSTIWREAAHVRLVWVTMLALSDRDGKVEASVPGLADASRVTLAECEDALKRLLQPDRHSRSQVEEGRRIRAVRGGWELVNHGYYHDLQSKDDLREKAALRQRKKRERDASRVTSRLSRSSRSVTVVTTPDQIIPNQIRSKAEAEESKDLTGSPRAEGDSGSSAASESRLRRAPVSLESALALPLQERASQVASSPELGGYCCPHEWPELASVAEHYRAVHGGSSRLGPYGSSRATRHLVDAFAAGHTPEVLRSVVDALKLDPWWQETGRRHGLDGLTLVVVNRVLAVDPEDAARQKKRADADEYLREVAAGYAR